MNFLRSKKNILIGLVLIVAFLLETPIRNYIIPGISLIPAVNAVLSGTIGYVAVFTCILMVTRDYMNKVNLIKAAVVVGVFAVVDRVIRLFAFAEILVLVYQTVRPILVVAVIFFAIKLITRCRIYRDNKVLNLGLLLLGANAILNVIEFISIKLAMQSVGNNFFAMVSMLTPSNSAYSILASLCSYAVIFLGLAFAQKCIDDDFYVV